VKELNKTIEDIKMQVETIKKIIRGGNSGDRKLGKKSGAIDASITNRTQEIEERISDTEYSIENIDTTIKENVKCKKIPKHPGNPGQNEKTKPKDNR
jgi:chaperonin cofactor prefoldin